MFTTRESVQAKEPRGVSAANRRSTVPTPGSFTQIPQAPQLKTLAERVSNGPLALQKKALVENVRQSPYSVAQRTQANDSFRGTAQLSSAASTPNRTGLPERLKSGVESLSGVSLDHVRVHYNSAQPAQLNALAYAQGSEIHVAPGQEKHLPHEAWHVVQQAQGRVRPTMQLKIGVPVNDDRALEHEADVMGRKALQMYRPPVHLSILPFRARRTGGAHPVQRQNAQQGGHLGGYANAGNTGLYNMQGAMNLPQGNLYTTALLAAPNVAGVMQSYIVATRAIGQALQGHEYLDKRVGALQQVPGMGVWGAQRGVFNAALTAWALANPAFAFPAGAAGRAAAVTQRNNLTINRQASRNDVQIGLIDPFVAQITIPQGGHAWVIQTNFSESALGYITHIQAGAAQVTGKLASTPNTFNMVSAMLPSAVRPGLYSPAHHLGVAQDVGTQIGSINRHATNQANHPGFDAVTKLGAEGARFEPVRQLGMALKVDSRFYMINPAGQTLFLTFQQLYTNWGAWFNRAYGVTAAQVRVQVLAHGVALLGAVTRAHDYNLDTGAPASVGDAVIVARMRRLLIARNWVDLAPLQRMYPDLYRTAQMHLFGAAILGVALVSAIGALSWYFSPRRG